MSEPSILFVKPKAISPEDKAALHAASVVVVEIKNPHDVKFMRANAEISSTEMLLAAMGALTKSHGIEEAKEMFTHLVASTLLDRKP